LGRLLITFLLCAAGALREPILYLSLFFKTHRQTYYDLLTRVRETGDWETWLEFFLTGVKDTSEQAVSAARRIMSLLDTDRHKIEDLGRAAESAQRIFQYAQTRPIFSISSASGQVGISFPTASAAVERLQRLGVLREITGRPRSRMFVYDAYLSILNEGTEPLR
jgi:Fic family protein